LAALANFTVNFLEVKVKVQGQNRRTENIFHSVAVYDIFTKFGKLAEVILA